MRKLMIPGLVLGMMAFASTARADFELVFQEDGGAPMLVFATSLNSFDTTPVTFGDATFEVKGTANVPGTATLATVTNVTISIQNNASSGHTFRLILGDTNYTSPTGSLIFKNSATTLFGNTNGNATAGDNVVETGYFSADNAQNANLPGPPDFTVTSGGTMTNVMSGTGPFSVSSNPADVPFVNFSIPFSLTIDNIITLAGTDALSETSTLKVVPSPEPASLVLMGLALPLLVAAGYLRKRQKAVQMA